MCKINLTIESCVIYAFYNINYEAKKKTFKGPPVMKSNSRTVDAVQFVLEPTTTSRHTYLCRMPSSCPGTTTSRHTYLCRMPSSCPGTTTSRHTYLCRMPSSLSWNYDLPTHIPLSDAVQFVLELRPPDTPTSVGCRLVVLELRPPDTPTSVGCRPVCPGTTTSRHTYLCRMPSSLSWNYDLPTHLPLSDAVQFVLGLRPPDTPTSVGCRPVCPGTTTSRHTYLCRMPSSLSGVSSRICTPSFIFAFIRPKSRHAIFAPTTFFTIAETHQPKCKNGSNRDLIIKFHVFSMTIYTVLPKSDSSGLRYSVRVTRKSNLAEVRQHQRQPTIANPQTQPHGY